MDTSATTHYRFTLYNRRVAAITIISALMLVVFGSLVLLPFDLGAFTFIAFILALIGLVVLLPMLFVQYAHLHAGIEIGPDSIRVQFPWEDPQQMDWSEARFAVDEGEEYLSLTRGTEGLGHLFGDTHYIRLHLEGMTPEQRAQLEQAVAAHVQVRQPRSFTLITLINAQGQVMARGRLYLFEHELLCMENRGKKRVFFYAPLKDLNVVKQVDSFYIGQLACEAFSVTYAGQEYEIMLGYETTISTNLGTSSRWSSTGDAQEWVEALRAG
jgi:hypothetical protein